MISLTITPEELNMIRECLLIAAKSPQVPLVGMRMIADFDAKLAQLKPVEPPPQ